MNCPHCQKRNPSDAKYCLHCGATFELQGDDGFSIDVADGDSGNVIKYALVGLLGTLVLIAAFAFGVDTTTTKCTRSEDEIAKFEAAPEWKRDTMEEQRMPGRSGNAYTRPSRAFRTDEGSRCYKKKTGHVSGFFEK